MAFNFFNYRKWYDNIEVAYEMMRCMRNKEVVVINPFKKDEAIRNIRINNAQQFFEVQKWINADKRTWNWYISLANYKEGIPYQSFDMEKRDNAEWNKEHWKSIKDFDFLIDFDCDDHEDIGFVRQDVLAVSHLFSLIPHSIRYSGMGYHIVIPGEYMPKGLPYDPEASPNYYDMLYEMLKRLKKSYSDFIDTGCHDARRVSKCPYSIALYEDDNYVCWPMRTLKEMDLEPINFLTSAVLSDCEPIRNRGVPLLNYGCDVSLDAFKTLLGSKYKRFIKDGN